MPKVNSPESLKGVKICRQAKAHWIEKFDKRTSPMGKEYYWLTGEFINEDKGEDTDEWALNKNFVSIVPVQYDFTAHHVIQELNIWDFG
jgi:5'-nucleotidase